MCRRFLGMSQSKPRYALQRRFRLELLMPRTHEDLERHELVDHRSGGPAITFANGEWCAIAIAHVAAERIGAGLTTYETLVEEARNASAHAHAAAVLRSANSRRVIVFAGLDGHESFRHLSAAWDDHHLFAAHHAVAESRSLTLHRLVARSGLVTVDPSSDDAYAIEHVSAQVDNVRRLAEPIAAATGFRGVLVFGTDDGHGSTIVYRFGHATEIDTFRSTPVAVAMLGDAGAAGDTRYAVHPIKTFS
jgi:hypothetical protein